MRVQQIKNKYTKRKQKGGNTNIKVDPKILKMLNEIANIISKNNVNMVDVSTDVTEGGIANIWIICKVQSKAKLNSVIKDIQKLKNVDSVERIHE